MAADRGGQGGRSRAGRRPRHARPAKARARSISCCCLDDAVNYLTRDGELATAVACMAANLAPGGILVFDANTLHTLRTAFASLDVVIAAGRVYVWEGAGSPSLEAGGCTRASIEVLERTGERWRRTVTTHCQRHHPEAAVREAIADAGLELVAVYGFTPDGRLWERADDDRHTKALYIARASAHGTGEGR